MTALTSDERSAEFKKSFNAADVLVTAKTELQKNVAKLFVAMIAAGDCQHGEMRKHGIRITGEDIREKLQDIYGLVNIFQAIVDGEIDLTEEDFDKMDSSKLALLSPFLTKDELKPNLEKAVKAAKTGTAKDIRDLKPKKDKEPEKPEAAKPAGTEIPIGFVATDISPNDPLVKSKQFRARLMADFKTIYDTQDGGALESMLTLFGRTYFTACTMLEADPLDFIAELAAENAKAAAGRDATAPAAIECDAVAA
jgi:hypothetical protein